MNTLNIQHNYGLLISDTEEEDPTNVEQSNLVD